MKIVYIYLLYLFLGVLFFIFIRNIFVFILRRKIIYLLYEKNQKIIEEFDWENLYPEEKPKTVSNILLECPTYDEMLFSFKRLTLKNWLTPDQIKQIS